MSRDEKSTTDAHTSTSGAPIRGVPISPAPASSPDTLSGIGRLGAYALLFAAYNLTALLGFGFRFQNTQIGVVGLAGAVLLSALLLTSRTQWWLVLVTTGVAHAAAADPAVPDWRVAWQIAGNSLFAVTTAEVLRRVVGVPLHFSNRSQVLLYTSVSVVSPTLFGLTTPAFIRSLLHLDSAYTPGTALARTMLANGTSMLLVAPVVILWAQHGVRRVRTIPQRRLLEAGLMMMTLVAVGVLAFGSGPGTAQFPSLLLWVFPPLLWAAVRFGPIGASTSLFCVAALSVWGTARQLGPFVPARDADLVLSLQLLWIVLCPPVMLLAAVIQEREQVETALQDQRNQLAHFTRMTTVMELSGTLTHELSQPLTSILVNAQAGIRLLEREPVDLRELRDILVDIREHDKQANGVIAHLRSFLKEKEARFETLGVETLVRDALKLGRATIKSLHVDVQTQIAPGTPAVHGDPVQLLQVMLNLIVNACESMAVVPAADRHLRIRVARMDEGYVELQIADSGVGLPAGSEERVFEPFFTTKPNGLGLGLAMCRSIATTHGGQLWAENNPGRGATFHLVLAADVN
ncbi:MAG TPA: ATP-binding protein [Vicinamibacterales bacterium]|nr:ATP-binding protein [Vicinamibacterales bacterium]